jgi:hypothetical protein
MVCDGVMQLPGQVLPLLKSRLLDQLVSRLCTVSEDHPHRAGEQQDRRPAEGILKAGEIGADADEELSGHDAAAHRNVAPRAPPHEGVRDRQNKHAGVDRDRLGVEHSEN